MVSLISKTSGGKTNHRENCSEVSSMEQRHIRRAACGTASSFIELFADVAQAASGSGSTCLSSKIAIASKR